jgi:hypothetical protein
MAQELCQAESLECQALMPPRLNSSLVNLGVLIRAQGAGEPWMPGSSLSEPKWALIFALIPTVDGKLAAISLVATDPPRN